MKKVSSLLSGIFLVGVMYAQTDTLPVRPNNQPAVKDTTATLRSDTTPSWRRDTLNWHKDSLNSGNLNANDSMTRNGNWNQNSNSELNKNDSSNLNPASTQQQPDLTPVDPSNSNPDKWKDSSATINNKYGDKKTKDETAETKTTITKTKKVVSDRVMMKDGEMLVIKKGVETKLEKSITLPDGNIVTVDGTVKMPDGSSVKLKDGEYINITPKKVTKTTKKTKTK